MAAANEGKIIDAKSVSFNEHVRVRSIENKDAKFAPLVGDRVIAKWEDDNTFYRATILEHLDDGRYKVDYTNYGPGTPNPDDISQGTTNSDDIFLNLEDIPVGSLIDFYIQQEMEELKKTREERRKYRKRQKQRLEITRKEIKEARERQEVGEDDELWG